MKRLLSILATFAMVFSFSAAFGDQMPTLTRDADRELGKVLFRGAPAHDAAVMVTGANKTSISGIEAARTGVGLGTALYNAELTRDADGFKGAAAGGITNVDENTKIWNRVLGPGGSDLP